MNSLKGKPFVGAKVMDGDDSYYIVTSVDSTHFTCKWPVGLYPDKESRFRHGLFIEDGEVISKTYLINLYTRHL